MRTEAEVGNDNCRYCGAKLIKTKWSHLYPSWECGTPIPFGHGHGPIFDQSDYCRGKQLIALDEMPKKKVDIDPICFLVFPIAVGIATVALFILFDTFRR